MKCNLPLDVAVLMDSSGSISRRNFQVFKRFIKSIITGFDVSEDHTHIAIIEYSTKASVQLKFNDFTGRALNRNNVKGRVNRIPHRRGKTFIDRALRLANEEVFTEKAGMRDWVKKVIFYWLQDLDGQNSLNFNRFLRVVITPSVTSESTGVNAVQWRHYSFALIHAKSKTRFSSVKPRNIVWNVHMIQNSWQNCWIALLFSIVIHV